MLCNQVRKRRRSCKGSKACLNAKEEQLLRRKSE